MLRRLDSHKGGEIMISETRYISCTPSFLKAGRGKAGDCNSWEIQ